MVMILIGWDSLYIQSPGNIHRRRYIYIGKIWPKKNQLFYLQLFPFELDLYFVISNNILKFLKLWMNGSWVNARTTFGCRPPAVHPQINNRHFCHKNPVKNQAYFFWLNHYWNANSEILIRFWQSVWLKEVNPIVNQKIHTKYVWS